ncbi:MAG: fumarylacetoacetate hydrolase family protein [Bacillus sp. (in: Bacteria)]|nr:fumarylacetoacetate hydrolase family protein [Bacillus sp. (in: firmicutes)]
MDIIKNIFCVGRNYADHAKELGNDIPSTPLLFSKPTHSLTKADGNTVQMPGERGPVHHELEIVLFINSKIPTKFSVEEVVGKMALGIDFTLRDEQEVLKKKGHPWLKAKGFPNAAVVTDFWDYPGTEHCKTVNFSLQKNGTTVQSGNIQSMLFSFHRIIEECNYYFGLGEGDIIFTGTPEGVGPVRDGDALQLFWGKEQKGSFTVRVP